MPDTDLKKQLKLLDINSVFDIARLPETKFITMYGNKFSSPEEAKNVYDAAIFYANSIAHHYRSGTAFAASAPHTAGFARPRYTDLFPDNVPVCLPSSVKVQDSPLAYLVDLYQFITSLAVSDSVSDLFKNRRPDIKKLCLSESNTNSPVSGLDRVNRILSDTIASKVNLGARTLDEYLAQINYPIHLPFNLAYVQISQCLKEKDVLLGDLLQEADGRYPYFNDDLLGFDSIRQKNGLLYDSGVPPEQINLLTNGKADPPSIAANYGFASSITELDLIKQLSFVPTLLQRLSLSRNELDQLVAINQYAPQASANVWETKDTKLTATPTDYGASYIYHADKNEPLITVTGTAGNETLNNLTLPRLNFINRLVRLQKYTNLSYGELDWLMTCVKNTENASENGQQFDEANVIRALGLFKYLENRYSIHLKEFTALIARFCPYSVTGELSQFDQVFNAHLLGATALQLNWTNIVINSGSRDDQLATHEIAGGLGIDVRSLQQISSIILPQFFTEIGAEGYHGELEKSVVTVSLFYRFTKLAQLFDFTVLEVWQLLKLIAPVKALSRFILPELDKSPNTKNSADNISILLAFEEAAAWLKAHQLTPAALIAIVGTEGTPSTSVANPQAINLFNELQTTLTLKESDDKRLADAIIKLYNVNAQCALDLVRWVGNGFSKTILDEVGETRSQAAGPIPNSEGTTNSNAQSLSSKFLEQLALLERYIAAVDFLKLTKTELQLLNSHANYFSEKLASPAPLNLKLVYLLTRLKDGLALASYTEEKTLNYFALANTAIPDANACNQMLAQLLNWSRDELNAIVNLPEIKNKFVKTSAELDFVLRIKELNTKTGLPTQQLADIRLFEVNKQPYKDYARVANFLLAARTCSDDNKSSV